MLILPISQQEKKKHCAITLEKRERGVEIEPKVHFIHFKYYNSHHLSLC